MQQLMVNVAAHHLFPYCKLATLKGGGGIEARATASARHPAPPQRQPSIEECVIWNSPETVWFV